MTKQHRVGTSWILWSEHIGLLGGCSILAFKPYTDCGSPAYIQLLPSPSSTSFSWTPCLLHQGTWEGCLHCSQLLKCVLGSMAHSAKPVLLQGSCSPGKNLAGVWCLDPGDWDRPHFQPWSMHTLWEGAGRPPGRVEWKELEGFLRSHKLRLLPEARLANIQEA